MNFWKLLIMNLKLRYFWFYKKLNVFRNIYVQIIYSSFFVFLIFDFCFYYFYSFYFFIYFAYLLTTQTLHYHHNSCYILKIVKKNNYDYIKIMRAKLQISIIQCIYTHKFHNKQRIFYNWKRIFVLIFVIIVFSSTEYLSFLYSKKIFKWINWYLQKHIWKFYFRENLALSFLCHHQSLNKGLNQSLYNPNNLI